MENLTATNTFRSEDNGITNISLHLQLPQNHELHQIDYILSSDNNLLSRVFDSSATNSDRWGLTATIKSKRAKNTMEEDGQETNWMRVSGPCQIQQ